MTRDFPRERSISSNLSRENALLAGAGLGVIAGITLTAASIVQVDLAKVLGLIGLGAGVATGASYVVLDYRHTTQRNGLRGQLDDEVKTQVDLQRQLRQSENRTELLQRQIEEIRSAIPKAHQEIEATLNRALQDYQNALKVGSAESARALQAQSVSKALQAKFETLQIQFIIVQTERDELLIRLNDLLESMDQEIAEQVKTRLDALRRTEIKRVADDYESLATQLFELHEQLEEWGGRVKEGHEAKSSLIRGLASEYNGQIDQLARSVTDETGSYIAQIEMLNEKLGRAYAENRGEILEVKKRDFGYSPDGAIANEIAVWVGAKLGIPLAVEGFHLKDGGSVDAGYGYSKSANPTAIVAAIHDARETCARNLGLYKIESVRALEIAPCILVTFRRERPAARAGKGTLYRSKEDFIKFLLSSRLFFRFIGSPGSGKTPTVMVILSHLLQRGFLSGNVPTGRKLSHTLIEFCNPLEGISVKNGSETEVFHRWSDPKEALRGLRAEYEFRKDLANKTYQGQVGYVWVCDEFTNAVSDMSKEQLKGFMKTLRDGGHSNMGAIVMSQEVMVSKAISLTIEDQKFFVNVLLDSVSIRTFLEEYGAKFYSDNAVKAALATLEQIEAEIEETNEYVCDTARQLRVAMVLADRSPVFYQLPYFDSADIDLQAYADTQREIDDIRHGRGNSTTSQAVWVDAETIEESRLSGTTDGTRLSPMLGSTTMEQKPSCPHCGSSRVRSKGHNWLCEDSGHSDRAPGKPKSWKK